jgi:hypothetical protein
VFVDGHELFEPNQPSGTQFGRPTTNLSFAYFDSDFSSPVEVAVMLKKQAPPGKVWIRPLSKDITAKVTGSAVTFDVTEPCSLSVEPFEIVRMLHIFANPIVVKPPGPPFPATVTHFGAGIHEIDPMELKQGQEIWIAGGAIVRTKPQANAVCDIKSAYGFMFAKIPPAIKSAGLTGVRVRGRGILDGRLAFQSRQLNSLLFTAVQ